MKTDLHVTGMSCQHCVAAVTKAVSAIEGVSAVEVDLDHEKVSVEHADNVTFDILKNEIEDQGYDVLGELDYSC